MLLHLNLIIVNVTIEITVFSIQNSARFVCGTDTFHCSVSIIVTQCNYDIRPAMMSIVRLDAQTLVTLVDNISILVAKSVQVFHHCTAFGHCSLVHINN